MSQSATRNPQSTIADEPSAYHVGWGKRELAECLTMRMGWGYGGSGTPLIENNALTNDQMADLLAALDMSERVQGYANMPSHRDPAVDPIGRHRVASHAPARCHGCGRGNIQCICGHCGGAFCPDCWDGHDCETKCLYCGFDPCRCDEVDAVADGLRRQGVKVTN